MSFAEPRLEYMLVPGLGSMLEEAERLGLVASPDDWARAFNASTDGGLLLEKDFGGEGGLPLSVVSTSLPRSLQVFVCISSNIKWLRHYRGHTWKRKSSICIH